MDRVDILENTIRKHQDLLEILLLDRTRSTLKKPHHILWATDSYPGHKPRQEINIQDITGPNTYLIQPRIAKPKAEQKSRTKDKAEVFTPKNIVYEMNQQIDWSGNNWPADQNNWQQYVLENKLEITCGEAPFIVGRYNAVSGKKVLTLNERVGFLDRKLQTVAKYTKSKTDWLEWTTKAFQASYGYEWQGDNLLLARENLLYTFIDYWNDKFPSERIDLDGDVASDQLDILRKIAEIISWNIFQMDGLRYVVPMSCKHRTTTSELPPMFVMLGEKPTIQKDQCPGCQLNDVSKHNGKYVKIMDWEKQKPIKFVSLVNRHQK